MNKRTKTLLDCSDQFVEASSSLYKLLQTAGHLITSEHFDLLSKALGICEGHAARNVAVEDGMMNV